MKNNLILHYFQLDKAILNAEKRMAELNAGIYECSLTTRTTFTETGISVTGSNVEDIVLDHIESLEKMQTTQDARKTRYKRFLSFYRTLSMAEQNYLCTRYIDGLDVTEDKTTERKALKEIKRIELELRGSGKNIFTFSTQKRRPLPLHTSRKHYINIG